MGRKYSSLSKNARIAVLLMGFIVLAIGAVINVSGQNLTNTGNQERETAIMKNKGELIPFEVDPQQDFDIQMGGFHFITTIEQLNAGFDAERYVNVSGFDYPFSISFNNGKLYVSAEIRNPDGDKVATIGKNQWGVSSDPVIAYDRNYNSYAFEVIDPNQVPILQVEMTPQNRIFVGGVFYSAESIVLAMLNGTTILNPREKEIQSYDQRLFRYPSVNNTGVMVNPLYASESPLLDANNKITEGNTLQIIGLILMGCAFAPIGVVSIDGVREIYVIWKKGKDIALKEGNKGLIGTETEAENENSKKRQHQYYQLKRKEKEKRKRRKKVKRRRQKP